MELEPCDSKANVRRTATQLTELSQLYTRRQIIRLTLNLRTYHSLRRKLALLLGNCFLLETELYNYFVSFLIK